MKKRTLGILATFIAIIGFMSMTTAIGEFKFENETHDFGTIPQNKPASYNFKFSNTGDAPIIINEVKPSCGCSVAEFTKTPVKPGEGGTVTVTYNAAATGPFTKQFTIKSNTKTPIKTLTIKGNVE
ncbi:MULTISPECIES: DUF1573 domain-containing protein [Sphingobacterium]|uniref:DUF1573 domain-containing protein n=2 Tax=Sphingobacterium TaxID=28453 RepID=A0A4Q6XVY8_9SPHI|nr:MULTISPECIES: DUF1573 domain-containing protein [Sphingobacterium]MBD1432119.1 DUF1573 domain-containing protein [Sphingobacterium micropteri]RZF61554.1 DUF1573 domain-containing protein [Sphingobacterium corticibacterium]